MMKLKNVFAKNELFSVKISLLNEVKSSKFAGAINITDPTIINIAIIFFILLLSNVCH